MKRTSLEQPKFPRRTCENDDAGSGSRAAEARPQEGCLDRVREPLPTRVSALPALPAAFHDTLRAGLDDLGIVPTEAALRGMDGHVRLLLAWNRAINLTAIVDPVEVARRHVLDSLTAVTPLRELGVTRLLDLGTGAGFPGIPLALVMPATALVVDSVGKKTRFVATAIDALGLGSRLEVATARSEDLALGPDACAWPAVTARAVASLADLVELALPLLAIDGRLVAWKRGDIDAELAAARRACARLGADLPLVRDSGLPALEGHRLVLIRKRYVTPAGYPRDPGQRRRSPW